MENQAAEVTIDVKPKYSKAKIIRNAILILIAATVAYLHYLYVWTLHENSCHFSHLSDLEREMSFRTECGFYYSYYKTIVEEPQFIDGIFKIMYDRLVECPEYVNAFNRFNIHPEVIIGAIYRYFEPVLNTTVNKQCYVISRGDTLKPVYACAGRGHPSVFYVHAAWAINALLPASVFLHATSLSESIFGGVLSILQYLANHQEATRVMWVPAERENFAAPLLFLQMWLLTIQLRERDKKTCFRLQITVFILNCLCLLFWQFSQFIFLTQIVIFFIMEQLKIIDLKTFCVFLHSHFCGLHMAVLLLQGNDMLKSSLYASTFVVISIYSLFFSGLRINIKTRTDFFIETWLVLLRIAIIGCGSIYLKQVISDFLNVNEDNHIWALLLSKLTDFKSFHTLIYTCSETFDFLPWITVKRLTKSLLLPMTILSVAYVLIYWLDTAFKEIAKIKKGKNNEEEVTETEKQEDADDSGIENNAETKEMKRLDLDKLDKDVKCEEEEYDSIIAFIKVLKVDPAIFYNLMQLVVFAVLAVLFMRLKLLFVTQMCVVCPLIVNMKYEIKPLSLSIRLAFWGILGAILLRVLYFNMSDELSYIGEFQDILQEELMEWIMHETSSSAVFAGSMPILATVMLTTRRAIVAHPHYEHAAARDRAYAVYKTYGRFSSDELYKELNKLQATYLIVQKSLCYGRNNMNSECSFLGIWDIEAPSHSRRPSLCHTLLTETTEHLYRVFSNNEYTVFRVHDLSVRYMPRVFDT